MLHIPATPMVLERSSGATDVGTHASTMELFLNTPSQDGQSLTAAIEWDIPTLERTEHIGLWFERSRGRWVLCDYDGVFSLPAEAVKFLRSGKYIVPREFE